MKKKRKIKKRRRKTNFLEGKGAKEQEGARGSKREQEGAKGSKREKKGARGRKR